MSRATYADAQARLTANKAKLDALNAADNGQRFNEIVQKMTTKETETAMTKTESETLSRGDEARAKARELGKRGSGTRMAFDELVEYVRKVRAAHPLSSKIDEREYAYWVEGISLSIPTWNKAWDAAEKDGAAKATTARKARGSVKKQTPGAKKRTTKKAEAKQQVAPNFKA